MYKHNINSVSPVKTKNHCDISLEYIYNSRGQHKGVDDERTIYAAVDSTNTHPFFAACMYIVYCESTIACLGTNFRGFCG